MTTLEEQLAEDAKKELLRTQKPPSEDYDDEDENIWFEILHSDWGDRD